MKETNYLPHHVAFVAESNKIEGINRKPTKAEMEEFYRFMAQDEITVADMGRFVSVYQPHARLRDEKGLNVRVGNYLPPLGSPNMGEWLQNILHMANKNKGNKRRAYDVHHLYERLHPFTDGNGRSGRMLWMWMMGEAPLGFLHTFYYQALSAHNI